LNTGDLKKIKILSILRYIHSFGDSESEICNDTVYREYICTCHICLLLAKVLVQEAEKIKDQNHHFPAVFRCAKWSLTGKSTL